MLRERCCPKHTRTPEQITQVMGVTMADVVEAEKQAMRMLEDPEHATGKSPAAPGLERSA